MYSIVCFWTNATLLLLLSLNINSLDNEIQLKTTFLD